MPAFRYAAPMVPDLNTILRWRAIARAGLRLVGLASMPASLAAAASWLIEGIWDNDWYNVYYYNQRIVATILFGAWGVMGLVFAGPISRLILPLPRQKWPPTCPYCRHELVGLPEPRCPECGRALTPELMVASRKTEDAR